MKKRNYRAQKVNEIRWDEVADRVKERTVVWAIDVAKVEQYGVLMDSGAGGGGHGEVGARATIFDYLFRGSLVETMRVEHTLYDTGAVTEAACHHQ